MTKQELFDLRDEINSAKEKLSELKGQKKILLKQLKDTWKCTTLKEGEKKIKAMAKTIDKLKNQINKDKGTLEEKYELNQ